MTMGRDVGGSTETARARLCARLDRPRTAEPIRLAVVSDVHFTTVDAGTSKQRHRTAEHLRTAIGDFDRLNLDAVICLGDLVHRGRIRGFTRSLSRLAALDSPLDIGIGRSVTLEVTVSRRE